jgi:hypothetical protein
MNRFGLFPLVVVLSIAWLALLFYLPLMFSLLLLLAWPFITVGHLLVDGYLRGITGLGLASIGLWQLATLLPIFRGHSDLAPYAQYMAEAQFYWDAVLIVVAALLAGAGGRSVLMARRLSQSVRAP